jgi:RNA-directed DNA polymerase
MAWRTPSGVLLHPKARFMGHMPGCETLMTWWSGVRPHTRRSPPPISWPRGGGHEDCDGRKRPPPMRHLPEGFDCLGCNIRHAPAPQRSRRGYKLLSAPRQGSIPPIRRKRNARWRQPAGSPTVALLNAMNPLISGWSQSCRTGVASRVFSALDTFRFARAQRSMPRRHPRQAGWWSTQQYGGRTMGPRRDRWVWMATARRATRRPCAWTRIVRHRWVPKTDAPHDPTRQDAWRQRRSSPQALADRPRPLASRPPGGWPVCRQVLANGEDLHVQQVLPTPHGGTDDLANRRLVHANCHRQIHSTSAPLEARRWLEPCTR